MLMKSDVINYYSCASSSNFCTTVFLFILLKLIWYGFIMLMSRICEKKFTMTFAKKFFSLNKIKVMHEDLQMCHDLRFETCIFPDMLLF